jgi:lipoprotein-anchoring transpeptidase ErfK/SrfK
MSSLRAELAAQARASAARFRSGAPMCFHQWVGERSAEAATGRRRTLARLAVPAALLVVIAAAVAVRSLDADAPEAAPTTTTVATTTTSTEPKPIPIVPVATKLATPNGEIKAYDGPDGAELGTVGFWYGYPMTMPIVEQHGAWLRIMRPERPNMSTAWVRREDVTLSSSTFRVVIRLAETRLTVYQDGFELFSAPVGIGKDSTPTAPGSFFVAVIDNPGPPGYGPIVLNTSGHSEAIQSWEGSGDAITAIHGPISASSDAQIGTTGTRISNGCIRMHEADQVKLDVIPLGTPVDIIA